MEDGDSDGMLLGKISPVVDVYSPELLHPMPRQFGRDSLLINGPLPFHGVDLWHAYELSWLNLEGKPEARVGRFTVPADSPNLVESNIDKDEGRITPHIFERFVLYGLDEYYLDANGIYILTSTFKLSNVSTKCTLFTTEV